jgi:hypothetical protein
MDGQKGRVFLFKHQDRLSLVTNVVVDGKSETVAFAVAPGTSAGGALASAVKEQIEAVKGLAVQKKNGKSGATP